MKTLRIKDSQKEPIRTLAINFNKKLVNLGKQPLRDSEIVHKLLDEAIKRAEISITGEIKIK